jgi:hypothetical protein
MRLAVGERCSTWGARPAELQLAAPRKSAVRATRTARSGDIARRGQGRATGDHFPEYCDQNVICRSSLGQIGNELSTGVIHRCIADYFVLSKNKLSGDPPAKRITQVGTGCHGQHRQRVPASKVGTERLGELPFSGLRPRPHILGCRRRHEDPVHDACHA